MRPAQLGCLRAFSETDSRPDLEAVTVPARRTQTGIARSRLEIYEGAPPALFVTELDRFNRDLLAFARS
jgi:hypothetical protein